jgi:hypothetical protein
MEDNSKQRIFGTFDWRWFVVGYCSLILFHLLPSYFLFGLRQLLFFRDPSFFMVWICIGIIVVSVYMAYRSNGWTLFEPPLASLLYITTVFFMFPGYSTRPPASSLARTRLTMMALALAVSFGGAIIGELLQMRNRRKHQTAAKNLQGLSASNS